MRTPSEHLAEPESLSALDYLSGDDYWIYCPAAQADRGDVCFNWMISLKTDLWCTDDPAVAEWCKANAIKAFERGVYRTLCCCGSFPDVILSAPLPDDWEAAWLIDGTTPWELIADSGKYLPDHAPGPNNFDHETW